LHAYILKMVSYKKKCPYEETPWAFGYKVQCLMLKLPVDLKATAGAREPEEKCSEILISKMFL